MPDVRPLSAQGLQEGPAWIDLWPDVVVAVGIAMVLLYWTVRYDEKHRFAWPVVAFLAGIGNFGLGGLGVALLYFHVRE